MNNILYPSTTRYFLRRFMIWIIFLFLICPFNLLAQISLQGGIGLLRVQDAGLVQQGDLYLGGFGSAYFEKSGSTRLNKNYNFSINATYGLASFLELSTRFVAYQDDQQHIWGPIGDTEFGFKLKVPLGEQEIIKFGFRNYFIIPTGSNHNLPYEPFTTDYFGWSPGGAISVDLTDVIYFPLKFYINGGYLDRKLSDELFASKLDQMYFGGGLKFSINNLIFFWEYYTEQFSNRSEVKFSENFQVSTQGLVFLGPKNLIVTLAADINLANPTDMTFFKTKQLADWKLWIGISKYIPLRGYLNEVADKRRREKEKEEALKMQQLIRKERISAEEELKRMQELLKKQEKKKKVKKDKEEG